MPSQDHRKDGELADELSWGGFLTVQKFFGFA